MYCKNVSKFNNQHKLSKNVGFDLKLSRQRQRIYFNSQYLNYF